jgi:pre-mRNA-splicing factor SYF1
MSHKHELARVLIDRQNIQFEEEVTRNPYHLRSWLKYLEYRNGNVTEKYILYERAIKFLPRSYKLWHAYLTLRHSRLDVVSITSKRYSTLVSTYERALVHMHKMPVIWYVYTAIYDISSNFFL